MRAALLRMDEWVRGGAEPPASRASALGPFGVLVPRATVISDFRTFPATSDLELDATRMITQRRIDAGEESARGILRYPVQEGDPFPDLVSAVDADGNEVGGIRLPDVSVPIATHTGWNPRDPAYGGAEQIIPMQGFSIAFPYDAAAREASDDPRAAVANATPREPTTSTRCAAPPRSWQPSASSRTRTSRRWWMTPTRVGTASSATTCRRRSCFQATSNPDASPPQQYAN